MKWAFAGPTTGWTSGFADPVGTARQHSSLAPAAVDAVIGSACGLSGAEVPA